MENEKQYTTESCDLMLDLFIYERELQQAHSKERIDEIRDKIDRAHKLLMECENKKTNTNS